MGARAVACGLGAWLLGGCTYGARGGAEAQFYSRGPVIPHATVTGFVGFGSTSRAGRNEGIVNTLTVGLGGDARGPRAEGSLLGGLEWFSVPDTGQRVGYRAGVEGGGRWRGGSAPDGEVLVQLRGGPVFRLGERRGEVLTTLGLDVTLGMASTLADPPADETSFVGGLAVTVGATRIAPFHF